MEGGREGGRANNRRTRIDHFATASIVYLNEFLPTRRCLGGEIHALLSFVVRKRLKVFRDGRACAGGGGPGWVTRGGSRAGGEEGEEEEEEEEEDPA